MARGSNLVKVRPNGRTYNRFFSLDEDLSCIRWVPTSKKASKATGTRINAHFSSLLGSLLCQAALVLALDVRSHLANMHLSKEEKKSLSGHCTLTGLAKKKEKKRKGGELTRREVVGVACCPSQDRFERIDTRLDQ